ncbi:MAG TPA: YiiX/YebB-like N1pC/P60 family cysteine hydrolase [Flavipsychrobacter sp.]|nr:YiiX/YebB-like N1pC/P60 family cysteine hydrolase [Flavipsychrobacter sp.]
MKKRKTLFVAVTLFVLCVGMVSLLYSFNQPTNVSSHGQLRISDPFNIAKVNSGIRLLHTGDIVLRTGADVTSYMFSQMNEHDKTYSHCGIVIIEKGYPFVYHSIGGEDNPDQILKRDSANFWFSPANNLGYGIVRYNLDSTTLHSLVKITLQFFKEKRRFDMDFDLRTDDKLYCAEFLYKALNEAVADSLFIKPSKMFGYTFVGVDNLFLNSHATFICQVRYK